MINNESTALDYKVEKLQRYVQEKYRELNSRFSILESTLRRNGYLSAADDHIKPQGSFFLKTILLVISVELLVIIGYFIMHQ